VASPRVLALFALFALLCACSGVEDPEPVDATASLVCDRAYLPAVQALAEGATSDLRVAQWELFQSTTTDRVTDALIAAADRGVDVRVLLDDTIDDNVPAVARLQDAGIDARLDTSTEHKLHVKMLIADGATAIVGSTNWSTSAIDFNRECNLRVDAAAAGYLAQWYDDVWNDPEARTTPWIDQAADASTVALVDDDLLPALVARLDSAQERVDFTMYATFLQPSNLEAPAMQVFGALAAAAARDVPVRGVVEWSSWNDDNNDRNSEAVSWLRARGVEIRWDRASIIMHAKTFAIDDVIQIQSANISSSGFEHNHEAGAWTSGDGVRSDFDEWYTGLWEESTGDPPL
jgi:phosphatidylserine/phosphatidylglycerophosphate/cardiolipin synthase-like enzyme